MGVMRKLPVVPICRNPSVLPLPPNQPQISRCPVLTKGRFAIVTNVGSGMRWTRQCRKTSDTTRTAKSCGPDAPTLASRSWSNPRATVAKEPGHRGEHEVTVKTIAQGRPDVFGEPVVTTLVCFLSFAREAAGASGTRLSLRPCFWANGFNDSGAICAAGGGTRVFQLSSPAKAGDPVFRGAMTKRRSRGVLDTPLSRGTTGHCEETDSDGYARP